MKLNSVQIENIESLNVGGWGGSDAKIADALGMIRQSAKFFDAIDTDGNEYEFKKQDSLQWIDLYKLACLSDSEKNITIVWICHKNGAITSLHTCNYSELIDAMNIDQNGLDAALLCAEYNANLGIQIKFPVKLKTIKGFTQIYKREEDGQNVSENV